MLATITVLRFAIDPLIDDLVVGPIASNFRSAQAALEQANADQRDALAAALSSGAILVSRSAPPIASETGMVARVLPKPLLGRIARAAGNPPEVRASVDANGSQRYSMGTRIAGSLWWITVSSARPPLAGVLLTILASLAVVGIAAFGAALASTRLVIRPMAHLSQELMDRRQLIQELDEPKAASIEVLGVIRAFNSLVREVEAAASSRRTLLAGLTHDLRSPLARLYLRAEADAGKDGWARMKPDLWVVGHIIDQFVAYIEGQNDAAQGPLRRLHDLARDLVVLYSMEGASITLSCIDADVGQALVPDLSMWRALMNLIDNAIAYGKAPFEIVLRRHDGWASVTVFDHGNGIAPHNAEKAFEPFVRLAAAIPGREHSGLGLAIVKLTSEQLGGKASLVPFDGVRSGVAMRWPLL
jgi:two-component system osmolarity sensor histidine kinase EnvZ